MRSRSILSEPLQYLEGVGPKRAALLSRELGVEKIEDLLYLFPHRYEDRSTIVPIASIRDEGVNVQFMGKVKSAEVSSDRKRLTVIVEDESGSMELVFFKGLKYTLERLSPGSRFLFFGKPSSFQGRVNFVHPEIDAPPGPGQSIPTGVLTGVYPSTEALRNAGVTNKAMIKMVGAAIGVGLRDVVDPLPEYILKERGLVNIRTAIYNIHFPSDGNALFKATGRMKFQELFLLQLNLLKQKYIHSRNDKGFVMHSVGAPFHECYKSLPYDLTGAQKRVIKEIREDMQSGIQMNRLLQGDVGSGKTLVAVLSCLIAVGNGFQACIMAPTEVLARQHYANIRKYLAPTKVKAAILTGSSKSGERREIDEGLRNGEISIIVGTHALLEDKVVFRSLGLAVIDEQHRFGVEQRSRLWSKSPGGIPPHVLVMTATPIPRTLAMTLYGDLDVSVIDEMPPGRKPVRTIQIDESKRYALNKFIKSEIDSGRQIFVVYPLIFESEKSDLRNLEIGYENMVRAFPFPPYKVVAVHGQQPLEEKNFNMEAFAAGRAHILVSTTVIEVGVDVPNASVMVIENAERFGLSQLHQLRGRVGRGSDKSYCILVRGDKVGEEGKKRLDLLCSTEDGFVLSEEDMKMRGPGNMEGTQQSGLPVELNIASLTHDGPLLTDARNYAQKILDDDPQLKEEKNAPLLEELSRQKYHKEDFSKIS